MRFKKILFFLFLPVFVISCSSDDDQASAEFNEAMDFFRDNYFQVPEGDFEDDSFPIPNSTDLLITHIHGNATILPGGSNNISVTASGNPTKIAVGIEGMEGYFLLPFTEVSERTTFSTTSISLVQLLLGQNLEDDFTLIFAVMDDQANVSEYEYLQVTTLAVGIGSLQVNCSWNQENDVDIHLEEPNGEVIFYANPLSENGGQLDVDSNAGCNIDNINSENIFYDEDSFIELGQYKALVDLWSNCNIQAITTYTVTIYYEGELMSVIEGENPYTGSFTQENDNDDPLVVATFEISETANRPSSSSQQIQVNSTKAARFHFESTAFENKVLNLEKN